MRLFCEQDAVQLGIEKEDGSILMDAFADHMARCETCMSATIRLKEAIGEQLKEKMEVTHAHGDDKTD